MIYPKHWFKSIHSFSDDPDLIHRRKEMEKAIEFLVVSTGETFIHSGGTVYWDWEKCRGFDIQSLMLGGITHYRVL